MQIIGKSKYNALFNRLCKTKDLVNTFINIAKESNYPIFRRSEAYPINLNIWGIRSKDTNTKYYNDVIAFFYENEDSTWELRLFEATTDPSNLNLQTPVNSNGCAILREGFHEHLWKIGKHKNQYIALVQANPCCVIRDNNKDDKIDFSDNTDCGMFGINLHRASSWKVSDEIGLYSAGCQVIKDINQWNNIIVPLIKKAVGKGYQSYVLINELDLD